MFKDRNNLAFGLAIAAVALVSVIICVCAFACSGGTLTFKTTFYFICYRSPDNAVSASSLSGTVSSYGGAGYILNYDGDYYVTVACYYDNNDAETVCANLKKRDLKCWVLKVQTEKYKLPSRSAKSKSKLYEGNLNTLNSLSTLAYECANRLDTGEYNQGKAKEVISAIKSGLNGLLKNNADNCFTSSLEYLITECDDKADGYVYSKDMRYIQIAVADAIINAELE